MDLTEEGYHVGCEDLKNAVQERVKPSIHCFGHIHECGGSVKKLKGTNYVNCSYVDERYRPAHSAVRLALNNGKVVDLS